MKAYLCLRDSLHYRKDAFRAGLEHLGYSVIEGITLRPSPGDVLVIWNRYGKQHTAAQAFESRGLPVIVAENAYLGNDFCGARWFALSLSHHNGAGRWHVGGPDRWDALGCPLSPWRPEGGEWVILPQRGIGPPGVAMPLGWAPEAAKRLEKAGIRARIRWHPGTAAGMPLEADLARASGVVTWGSGAAIKAILAGIPAVYGLAKWIGGPAGLPLGDFLAGRAPNRGNDARLGMFRRLIWAQWRLSEIENGTAFRTLLKCASPLQAMERPEAGKFAANKSPPP